MKNLTLPFDLPTWKDTGLPITTPTLRYLNYSARVNSFPEEQIYVRALLEHINRSCSSAHDNAHIPSKLEVQLGLG